MAYKPRFGTRLREALYQREQLAAHKAARGEFPICVHCDQPVTPGQAWDEAHVGTPRALGGTDVGVGHRLCNRLDNNVNVTPTVARVKRVRLRHLGVTGPGLGRHALPAGKRSPLRKTVKGTVVARLSGAEKHRRLMARRNFASAEEPTPELVT
jgi:hypothetical protein